MSWSWTYLALIALVFAKTVAATDICANGGTLLCSDGSKPSCVSPNGSGCPKACDPHHNNCDSTAPTCIFPDPRVTGPRGACACRPGYKATGFIDQDKNNHWRLPVEAQEHRVWVAEGVKCDTLCDISTGIDSCLEITLLTAECVGGGFTSYNDSLQSTAIIKDAYNNYSQSLPSTKIGTAFESFANATAMAEPVLGDFDGAKFDTEDHAELADPDTVGTNQETGEDEIDEDSPASGDGPIDIPETLDDQGNATSDDLDKLASTSNLSAQGTSGQTPTDAPVLVEADESTTLVQDVPVESESASEPIIEARDQKAMWSKAAEEKGRAEYTKAWKNYENYVKTFSGIITIIDSAHRPGLCSKLTQFVVDSCKRGVRTQVAFCKQALRDKIAKCKVDQNARIDKCKRSYGKWDPRKMLCVIRMTTKPPCESQRLNIPFCEFERLTTACCEATRTSAQSMCSAGISTRYIQKQIQLVQTTCSVGASLVQAATKSYLTGQVLGVITQLESVKEIGDSVQAIRKVEGSLTDMQKWADGLSAAAGGNIRAAESNLGSLLSQISPDVGKTVSWAQSAQAVVTKNGDTILKNAIAVAGDIQAIQSARKSIKALANVANDVKAISTVAENCARIPATITPEGYPQWKAVVSEEMVDPAVEIYKKAFAKQFKRSAKCHTVVVRTKRLLLSK